jgi:hypothetical protein
MHRLRPLNKGLALRANACARSCEAASKAAIPTAKMLTPTVGLPSQAKQQKDSKTRPGHDADEVAQIPSTSRAAETANTSGCSLQNTSLLPGSVQTRPPKPCCQVCLWGIYWLPCIK